MSSTTLSRMVMQPASRPRASPMTESGTRVRDFTRIAYQG